MSVVADGIPGIRVFSTCPQSTDFAPDAYRRRVAEVARWSEAAGCEGMLVYTNNTLVDPWLVSQLIVEATERIRPLVAVQPLYMHPYAAAKMIASLGFMHGRRIDINLLAGGFRNDLRALGDETEHDARYRRALEYGRVISRLAAGGPCTFEGDYYRVRNLRLAPALAPELVPQLMISGSSEAGMAVAEQLGAVAVKYPEPAEREPDRHHESVEMGMRIGVIARDDAEEAWAVARRRFPENRTGAIAHQMARRVSDSRWHAQLSTLAADPGALPPPYWLGPFQNYGSYCPYLVGDHDTVAGELGRYMALGFTTFLLDIPPAEEELDHTRRVLAHAAQRR